MITESCRVLSILMNFFYMARFMFMFLEAIYLYSMVGWIVKKVNRSFKLTIAAV